LNPKTTLIANDVCWIEHTAKTQLEHVSNLPGVVRAVGLPDLHAGKNPVGIAVETDDILYPHLIGNDIGCGMGLFETPIALKKYKQEKMVSRLNHIRALEDVVAENPFDEESPIYDLGTIGGGNHFAEFQVVHGVFDEQTFETLGIDKGQLLLLIHSGSRGYGERILSEFLDYGGLPADSTRASDYLKAHDNALLWAYRNRSIVAQKLIHWLGYGKEARLILDCHHNYLEKRNGLYLHRKGAVSALNGPVVIPGSRGSLTYLVMPATDTAYSAHSLSHGAGRKWARSLCKSRIKNKYDRDTIRENKYGGRVVCHDTDLLFQEAPEAYKNIEHVIASLLEHKLCTVIATLRPLLTYKG
jgi:release factor H-coupled RctB family protein